MKNILKKIKHSNKVAVFGHQSPDGDCVGCLAAICFLCEQFGKTVDAYVDDEIPLRLSFLDTKFINKHEFNENDYDLFISVDVADKHQLGKYSIVFDDNHDTISIDHHSIRDLVSKITYVDKKASCCEILFELLTLSKIKLNSWVATFLYLGVSDDTGCFMHDSTTSYSHYVASKLFDYGADFQNVNYHLFKLVTQKTYELTKKLEKLAKTDGGIRYVVVTQNFLKDNNCKKSDFGDYVNTLLNLEGTKISFTMVEIQKDFYSLSFRSLKSYNVANVASKFNGGGHPQAAGGRIGGYKDVCLKNVIDELKLEIHNKDASI